MGIYQLGYCEENKKEISSDYGYTCKDISCNYCKKFIENTSYIIVDDGFDIYGNEEE